MIHLLGFLDIIIDLLKDFRRVLIMYDLLILIIIYLIIKELKNHDDNKKD